jgi:ABC-type branched-subunit amino acid transport system substrate-binding protein
MKKLGILLVALLAASGCTGAPRPDKVAAKNVRTDNGEIAGLDATTTTTPGADTTLAANAAAGTAASSAAKKAAAVAAAAKAGAPNATNTVATLFRENEDRVGITNTSIKLCGHAALILASAFNTKPEDLNVYWQMVRDRGGIYGRNVDVTFEDDQYKPDVAVQAAEKCKAKNPFFILGGIGFDQIPAVRNWAEANRQLYFHHIAVADTQNHQFSFSGQPTVEAVGKASGEYLLSHHRSEKLGVIYRQSENWQPGFEAGRKFLSDHGVGAVSLPVQKDASVYSPQIAELQRQQVKVVWVWENALAAAEFIKQARGQNYNPTFVVFPFQTTLDVLGDAGSTKSRIEGVATWPAYKRGGYHDAIGAAHEYDAEIARFEAAMAKYRPSVTPNDILFQVWLGYKGVDELFQRCGPDCTRNKMAGLFLGGLKTTVEPGCAVDFSKGNHHVGSTHFYTQEAVAGPYFRTTQWCSEHL